MHIDWSPLLQALLQGVLIVAAAAITVGARAIQAPLIEWLRSKASEKQRSMLYELAHEAVHFAEAMGVSPEEKKALAIEYVGKALGAAGVSVDCELTSDAIESALAYAKDVFSGTVAPDSQ